MRTGLRTISGMFIFSSFLILTINYVYSDTKFFVRMGLDKGGGSIALEIDDLANTISRVVTAPESPTEYRGETIPGVNGSSGYAAYSFYDVNFTLPYDLKEGTVLSICGRGDGFPLRPGNESMPGQFLEPYSCTKEMVRDNLVVAFL